MPKLVHCWRLIVLMNKFVKGVSAMIAAIVEFTMITLAGCTRPFGDLTKSARGLMGKK